MRHHKPNGVREHLIAVFGPSRWAERAARVLGVSHRHAWQLAAGSRRLRKRHVTAVLAYLEGRHDNAAAELERRKAALDREYAEYENRAKASRAALLRLHKEAKP